MRFQLVMQSSVWVFLLVCSSSAYSQEHPDQTSFERTYSKADLVRATLVAPGKDLFQTLGDQTTAIFSAMQVNPKNTSLADLTAFDQITHANGYFWSIATLRAEYHFESTTATEASSFLTSQASHIASQRVQREAGIDRYLNSGFNLRVDFLDLFNTYSATQPKAETPRPSIRYGLVLKTIEPRVGGNLLAAVMSDYETYKELKSANKAKTVYTIGPIQEETRTYKLPITSPHQDSEPSIWEGILSRLPGTSYRFNFAPEFATASLAGTKVAPGNQNYRMSVYDSNGVYQYSQVKNIAGQVILTEHSFSVPIAGTVKATRIFDQKMEPTKALVTGILYSKDLPPVNVGVEEKSRVVHVETTATIDQASRLQMRYTSTQGFSKDNIGRLGHYEIGFNTSF